MKIAISGFGRIGRAAAKIALEQSNVELVAINDLGDINTLAHLLKYDSCYGIYNKEIRASEGSLIIGGKKIKFISEKEPAGLPWKDLGIDVVIESTGVFTEKEKAAAHIKAGTKKVIMSAPAKDEVTPTYVVGVNTDDYKGEEVISCASCTTNCITPIMKVLEDTFGIAKSLMTTIHSYTADQNLVDGPHKDLRRARAAAINIVPTTTGAAKAAYKTIPTLKDRFDGLAIRVPTPVVSLSDITVLLKKKTTAEEINKTMAEAAKGKMKNIIEVTSEPVVSTDIIGNPHSAIVDLSLTQVIDGDLVKIIAWYDNEWGYSNRLVELAGLINK
ncbi:MAG: type I glyceraldehyde-3-phosphate dehydrogenase [Patescibacteria group bacterium]